MRDFQDSATEQLLTYQSKMPAANLYKRLKQKSQLYVFRMVDGLADEYDRGKIKKRRNKTS